jgi:hypothetical protein
MKHKSYLRENMKTRSHNWLHGSVVALSFLALVSGCSKLQQNPFTNVDQYLKDPVPPGYKPDPGATPMKSDELRIDADEFYSTTEGDTTTFQISGRVLTPIDGQTPVLGKQFQLQIENLGDFPGARFDGKTGAFEWTPQPGFVEEGTKRIVEMRVTMDTTTGLSTSRRLNIYVMRKETDPSVERVDSTLTTVTEGDYRTFKVTVRDPDGDDTPNGHPRLVVTNAKFGQDIGSLVSVISGPVRDTVDKALWNYTMALDLRDAEVSKSISDASFGLIVISQFGHSSNPTPVNLKVRTLLAKPVASWLEDYYSHVSFLSVQDNTMTFTVTDPKAEGTLGASFTRCEPGANCSCSTPDPSKAYILLCKVRWFPSLSQASGNYTFSVHVTNSVYGAGVSPAADDFNRVIEIKAPPPLPPTPTPYPTPSPTPVVCPTPFLSPTPAPTPTPTPTPKPHHKN